MNNIQKRFLLFLIGCIGTRFAIALFAKNINTEYLPYLGVLACLPLIGWLYLYFIGKRDTGAEVFGDKIWWSRLRIFHAIFYALFIYNAFNKNKIAWIFLLIDVIFGLILFLFYHYNANNFNKLL